jgi:Ca2+/H+ antiporter
MCGYAYLKCSSLPVQTSIYFFHASFNAYLKCSLSFVTEQVAEHTNGTIGALLNATFGNAPELLIATAALRSGFYRVVQLAMLGSMLTNLLFVFGISCLVGGLRWQVQELRITSGNVSVGMLLLSTAGSLLPATLVLGGQLIQSEATTTNIDTSNNTLLHPSKEELQLCRVNAFVMMFMYGCYLVFQLGTHKEEFDEEDNIVQTASDHALHLSPHFTSRHGRQSKASQNLFCMNAMRRVRSMRICRFIGSANNQRVQGEGWVASPDLMNAGSGDVEMATKSSTDNNNFSRRLPQDDISSGVDEEDSDKYEEESDSSSEEGNVLLPQNDALQSNTDEINDYFNDYAQQMPPGMDDSSSTPQRRHRNEVSSHQNNFVEMSPAPTPRRDIGSKKKRRKKKGSNNAIQRPMVPLGLVDPHDAPRSMYTYLFNLNIQHCHHYFSSVVSWTFLYSSSSACF